MILIVTLVVIEDVVVELVGDAVVELVEDAVMELVGDGVVELVEDVVVVLVKDAVVVLVKDAVVELVKLFLKQTHGIMLMAKHLKIQICRNRSMKHQVLIESLCKQIHLWNTCNCFSLML